MRKLSAAFLIAAVLVMVALAGCGGGGGTSTPKPPPSGTFTVTGTVIDDVTAKGVANVIIKFGAANLQTTTDANGHFSIDTGVASAILAYSGVGVPTFTVSTANLPQPNSGLAFGSIYPATFSVHYDFYAGIAGYYPQSAVLVPNEVMNGSTSSLGNIKVLNFDEIPPPPF